MFFSLPVVSIIESQKFGTSSTFGYDFLTLQRCYGFCQLCNKLKLEFIDELKSRWSKGHVNHLLFCKVADELRALRASLQVLRSSPRQSLIFGCVDLSEADGVSVAHRRTTIRIAQSSGSGRPFQTQRPSTSTTGYRCSAASISISSSCTVPLVFLERCSTKPSCRDIIVAKCGVQRAGPGRGRYCSHFKVNYSNCVFWFDLHRPRWHQSVFPAWFKSLETEL